MRVERVIIQTKGRKRGRVGVLKFIWNEDAAWVRWVTRGWVLPEQYDAIGDSFYYIRTGARISAEPSLKTLRRYGIRYVSPGLLAEWQERHDEAEYDHEAPWSERYARQQEIREEIMERAEPVEFDELTQQQEVA